MKTTAQNFTQPKSLLLLGEPGSGKTTLGLQFPGIFVLDCDVNLAGPVEYAKRNNLCSDVFYGNPTICDDGTLRPRGQIFEAACKMIDEAHESPDVKGFFIDSLTTFSNIVLDQVMKEQGRRIGSLDFKTPSSKTTDEPLQIQDWNSFLKLMVSIIMKLKASGKTLIMSGHIKTDKDGLTGSLKQYISCPGQMSELIAGYFSEVWLIKRETKLVGTVREETRSVITFPQSETANALGLKSSVGVKSGSVVDLNEMMKLIAR